MRHFFVDANIVIDFLAERKPFSENASKIFEMAALKYVKLYLSAVSFNNIYYIVRQTQNHNKTVEMLNKLAKSVEIIAVNNEIINKALSSDFNDFEDAIQNFSAESIPKIEAITTRDKKGFKNSSLPVFNPESAISLMMTK